MKTMSRKSTERIRRARSSRRWSASAIRPSGPTGWCGRPRSRSTRPATDNRGAGSGVVVAAQALALGVELGLASVEVGLLPGPQLPLLGGGRARRAAGVAVRVVVGEALGLGLED